MIKFLLLLLSVVLVLLSCDRDAEPSYYAPEGKLVEQQYYYLIGVHPYLTPQKTFAAYQPIINYLESHLDGVHFLLETSVNYDSYDQKLYQGNFDFSVPNPYQTFKAEDSGHYDVIAKMKPDDVFRGVFVARKSLNITSVQQLKGKTVSFPAPTAIVATMMPLYYLYEQGLDVKHDIKMRFTGSQYSSIMSAYSGDSVVAATWPTAWEGWKRENPDLAQSMELVWQTESLVNVGVVVNHRVDPLITQQVRSLLITLDQTEEGKRLLQNAGFAGFDYADHDTYLPVRDYMQKYHAAMGE